MILLNYMPHGMCLSWDPQLVYLHVISDLAIAISYFSIPIALGYFAYHRRDLHFRWLFVLFVLFIMACGTTHFLSVWVLWNPNYWLDGYVKAFTALVSVITAMVIWPLIPQALAIPGPNELQRLNVLMETEIYERKATELLLREGEASLLRERDLNNAIISGLPGIFYIINSNYQFDRWNDNLETVTGYSATEIRHMNPLDFFIEEEKPLIKNTIDNIFADGPGVTHAFLCTKNGARIYYHFTGRCLGSGTDAQLIGVGIDVSAHLRMEEMLHLANAELERFAEISAHHLMEPARRLAAFAQRLRTELLGRIDAPDALIALNFIEQQAMRLRALLRDIQLYLVADRFLGATQAIDAEKVAQKVVADMAELIQTNAATVVMGPLPPALIDAQRLTNIFTMLLTNSLEYRDHKHPCEIRINGQKHGTMARYRIIDNGYGIPTAYHERVFRVFERLHPKPKDDSTGIGLPIVRKIVTARGGRTWIENTPGGGTTVVIELPTRDAVC